MDDAPGQIDPSGSDWPAEEALRRKQRRAAFRWLLALGGPVLIGWWGLLIWAAYMLARWLLHLP